MQNKLRRILQKQDGIAILLVLCLGALFVALAAALGAELGAKAAVSLTAAAGLAFYLQRLLPRGDWRRFVSPCLACGALMHCVR